mmetsp:Transcript_247/g.455  ORF Transcript_247/g.455 Transcript_247/m.455 type:complete len:129 (-) Transcript_247:1220-1606(-)|eukprot:CAMPEP_0181041036 /NCGR_PEP_ID=MMETSP1070-20121207/11383_1 /TAXON_ID=265543 /ORGANISM="Minutocellus polymorphus, Strain NH13" /LENGTH=128 /DNA_ID=CAMNT_0023119117 /DNA_START=25 /DNA_END=411 /DNA_ORIENTATION=-
MSETLEKKPKVEDQEASEPATKKAKTKNGSDADAKEAENNDGTELLTNDDEERYLELGPKKRCTIRQWKKNNMILVDIREFYEKDGKALPGKKGISLTLAQYQSLRAAMLDGSIDGAIAALTNDGDGN